MANNPSIKRPSENRVYGVNFGAQPEIRDGGLTILSGTATGPGGITVGGASVAQDLHTVAFRVADGTDATDYDIDVTASLSDGTTLLDEVLTIQVRKKA